MRRFLVLAGCVLAMMLVWASGSAARAATLADCLASHHVCVASAGRGLVSQSQQDTLEKEIGRDDIYLVVKPSGPSGYDDAMRQVIDTLSARHEEFTVGFLDSSHKHFGADNQGMLSPGGAADIATTVVDQHRADGDVFAALQEFVRDVQRQSGPGSGPGGAPGNFYGGLIPIGVIGLLVAGGYFGLVRPRRIRRQEELRQQLKEVKAVAQEDLLALNKAIADHANDVTIAGSPDAAAEQSAALDAYERGTRALDAARGPADMGAVSSSVAEGRYRLACAEALAKGQPKPGRLPMCFFDPRHGMSVADVSWAPPDGGPSRDVAACVDCQRVVERGDQPVMRTVQDRFGDRVVYINSGFAPAYWGGFGFGGDMFAGFLLGEALASPGWGFGGYDYGGDVFGGANFGGGGDFGGGDFGGGGGFGGGNFGGGGGDFGGGGF